MCSQSPQLALQEPSYSQARDNWLLADYWHLRHHKLPTPPPFWAKKHHSWVWETLISPPAVANTRCFRETRHPVWVNTPEFAAIRCTKPTAKSRLNDLSENKVQKIILLWNIFQQYQVWKELPPHGRNKREKLHNTAIHGYTWEDKDFVNFVQWWLTAVNPTWIFILSYKFVLPVASITGYASTTLFLPRCFFPF